MLTVWVCRLCMCMSDVTVCVCVCCAQFCVGTIEEDYLGVIGMPNE